MSSHPELCSELQRGHASALCLKHVHLVRGNVRLRQRAAADFTEGAGTQRPLVVQESRN